MSKKIMPNNAIILDMDRITLKDYMDRLESISEWAQFLNALSSKLLPKLKRDENFFKGLKGRVTTGQLREMVFEFAEEALLSTPEEFFDSETGFLSLDKLCARMVHLAQGTDNNRYRWASDFCYDENPNEEDEKGGERMPRYSGKKETCKNEDEDEYFAQAVERGVNRGRKDNNEKEEETQASDAEEADFEAQTSREGNWKRNLKNQLRQMDKNFKDNGSSFEQEYGMSVEQAEKLLVQSVAYCTAATKYIQAFVSQDEKRRNRFLAMCLYARYQQAKRRLEEKPSERGVNVRGEKAPEINAHLVSHVEKYRRLLNHYHPMGFWQDIMGELFVDKLNYTRFDTFKVRFEKYRGSLTAKPARAWKEEREKLLEHLRAQGDFNTGLDEQGRERLLKAWDFEMDIQCFTPDTKLERPRLIEEISEGDAAMGDLENEFCCEEYEEALSLYVREMFFGKKDCFSLPDDKLKEYMEHRKTCSACIAYEERKRKQWQWRLNRLQYDLERAMLRFYPEHTLGENSSKSKKNKEVETAIRYYEMAYQQRPSDLYAAYLDILHKRNGKKEGFKPSAENMEAQEKRNTSLGYTLETRCMCGAVNRYTLNALRFPRVTVGRKQEDGELVAHINLCGDDEGKLSRETCCFKYDTDKNDWMFELGTGDKEHPMDLDQLKEIASRVFYMKKNDFFDKLDALSAGGESLACNPKLGSGWTPMEANKRVPLSEIACICVVSGRGFTFNKKKSAGIFHPIFGLLERTAWFIEINANRSDVSVVRSMVTKSEVAQ